MVFCSDKRGEFSIAWAEDIPGDCDGLQVSFSLAGRANPEPILKTSIVVA
ncbi:MAG: hypothetical protein ACMUJM_19560 [bacterium]